MQVLPKPKTAGVRSTRELPPDLLQQASRRLGLVSLIYAGTYFFAYWIGHFIYVASGMDVEGHRFGFETTVAGISIAMSFGMYALTRWKRMDPHQLLHWGLAYEVLGALGISLGYWGMPVVHEGMYFGLSWVCVWILVFPLIVPVTPERTLRYALLSATTSPLVTLASWMVNGFGGADARTASTHLAGMFYPNYLCAAIAYLAARIMQGLGTAVREAREMGSYELIEILGSGGMGEVWRARHRMLARPAAIKLLRPEVVGMGDTALGRTALRRFELEAQATAGLRSPHTIELYDFGNTEDGTFYYVMELLDGLDLETLVHRCGPQPPGRVIHIVRQVCHSLEEAHRAGMVHRDIKPANIFVCRLGLDLDFVKVLDFGIVKARSEAAQGDTRLTQEGAISGTPAYMAPEAALADREIDGRADLYSLGCVAYWLLTGKTVFEGDSSMRMMLDHVRTDPVPPSQRAGSALAQDLEQIVLACLEKDRATRPQSARALAQQLAACKDAGTWTPAMMQEWWVAHLPVGLAGAARGLQVETAPSGAETTAARHQSLRRA